MGALLSPVGAAEDGVEKIGVALAVLDGVRAEGTTVGSLGTVGDRATGAGGGLGLLVVVGELVPADGAIGVASPVG